MSFDELSAIEKEALAFEKIKEEAVRIIEEKSDDDVNEEQISTADIASAAKEVQLEDVELTAETDAKIVENCDKDVALKVDGVTTFVEH